MFEVGRASGPVMVVGGLVGNSGPGMRTVSMMTTRGSVAARGAAKAAILSQFGLFLTFKEIWPYFRVIYGNMMC